MTRKITIAAGLLLILVLGGMWVYAFLHPSVGNDGFFARFGAGDDAENIPSVTDDAQDFEDGTEEGEARLRQITTNPVAGAVFVENGIRYVEQGTGHIQYIDLVSGEETLLSGTTIPGAYDASFSEDGETVAITTSENGVAKTIVGIVPDASRTGTLDGISLPLGATEVNVSEKLGVAYYLVKSVEGARGYAYNISKKTSTELFSIPLRDVHVLWSDPVFIYTTPTNTQVGYIYKIVGSELEYVDRGGIGLMAFPYQDTPIVTRKIKNEEGSSLWISTRGEAVLGGPVIPEKCTLVANDLVCGVPSLMDGAFPDSWYKGIVSSSDSLWEIDGEGENAHVLSDLFAESGRQIDVLKVGSDTLGTNLYFINKNDNTLWLYEI